MLQEVSRVAELAASIVAAHAGRTTLDSAALPGLLAQVSSALRKIDDPDQAVQEIVSASEAIEAPRHDIPADVDDGIFVRNGIRTVYDRHIICLEDNREVVLLERYLRRKGIPVADYLEKWNLPQDYPMVAPGYVAEKRASALETGLGKTVRPKKTQNSTRHVPARRRGTLHPSYGAGAATPS